MSSVKKIIESLYRLMNHWSLWNKNEDYYLNQLVQELMINQSKRDHTEEEIFSEIRSILSEEEWNSLPKLIKRLRTKEVARQLQQRKIEIARHESEKVKERRIAEQKHQQILKREETLRRQKELQEITRITEEKRELDRVSAFAELTQLLEHEFLETDDVYLLKFREIISDDEYQSLKIHFVQNWVYIYCSFMPDEKQALAISSFGNNIQLVARAGSGKTATIVTRAIFLHLHCQVPVDNIMILAFNKDAVKEVTERLEEKLQSKDIPHVRTFHSLAYAVVHPSETIIFDDSKNGMGSKSKVIQEIVDSRIRNDESFAEIKALMLTQFSDEWELIVAGGYDKSPEEFVKYRRDMPTRSIKGDVLKSFGEKLIANCLFEYNVNYGYEYSYRWNGQVYRPDFTIKTGDSCGVIIEYFGMVGDKGYDMQIIEKREFWRQKEGWKLIELYPSDIVQGVDKLISNITSRLVDYGVPMRRLSEEEIWDKIKERELGRFTIIVNSFIQRCRKRDLTPVKLRDSVVQAKDLDILNQQFLPIVTEIYSDYIECLKEIGSEDFDGLMSRAASEIGNGNTLFVSKGRSGDLKEISYFMIDEYQDFSKQFNQLISSVIKHNSTAEFFCVGDDWQAINGFAGSDLVFFQNFEDYFSNTKQLELSSNYRSKSNIVELGNTLMQGLGNYAVATKTTTGEVSVAYIDLLSPAIKENEKFNGDLETIGLLRLINKALKEEKDVVILHRKNSNPWSISRHLKSRGSRKLEEGEFLKFIQEQFPKSQWHKIKMSTTHKFKGKENDVVIVIDAMRGNYPLIHPDWIYNKFLGESIEKIEQEELRLFYVAITRAVDELIFMTKSNSEAEYLYKSLQCGKVEKLDWQLVPSINLESTGVMVKIVENAFDIKEQLKSDGFRWDHSTKTWWRGYENNPNIMEELLHQPWSLSAKNVLVYIDDTMYNVNNGIWNK